MAKYFRSQITFLRPNGRKTPDFLVHGIHWELKSPRGDSKNTIANNMREARKQSQYIILDFRRLKMHQTRAKARLQSYLTKHTHHIRQVLVIEKSGKVVEFYRK